MYSKQTTVINRSGLHARPASEFVIAAKTFESKITVCNISDGETVNAKSISRILAQGMTQGTKIEIAAEGVDEQQAVDQLVEIVDSGFGE